MSELEKEYRKDIGEEHSTMLCYSVEARNNFPNPCKIGEQIFDEKWRKVVFVESEIGIYGGHFISEIPERHGLVNYPAAQALRWWFHTIAEAMHHHCIETRLVRHEIESNYKITAMSYHDVISESDRRNIIPDWDEEKGKK